jgi:hypothetical protein
MRENLYHVFRLEFLKNTIPQSNSPYGKLKIKSPPTGFIGGD